jgi:hypothetical protein
MSITLIHHSQKEGRVCWISNLPQLNKVIRCKQYPLPIVTDILRKPSGYKFFTKLDVSMQYYTFELDKESQDLCTIITLFGKYKYLRLPMLLKCSPDINQAAMENVLTDINNANVYIDDVGAFSSNWDHHVNLGCDFFCWKTNTQIRKRTFRNNFFGWFLLYSQAMPCDFVCPTNMQIDKNK